MLLSRIADSMYWTNRYMQRAQVLLRVIANQYILSLDKDVTININWNSVLEMFTELSEDEREKSENDTAQTIYILMLDYTNNNSFINIITRARENARGVQDHITKELWEEMNGLYRFITNPNILVRLQNGETLDVLEELINRCVVYSGTAEITMPRGSGWNFMALGQYFERGMTTVMIAEKQFKAFDYDLAIEKDIVQWRLLLLSLSGYELYLKTYQNVNYNLNVIHQVFFNENFPHSLIYSLRKIDRYLKCVVTDNSSDANKALLKKFERLYSRIRYMDLEELKETDLKAFVSGIKQELQAVSSQLGHNFFSYM